MSEIKLRTMYVLEGREHIRFETLKMAEHERERVFIKRGVWHEIKAVEVKDTRGQPCFHDIWDKDGNHRGWYA
jgi:hypothetical protein